jgi:hypothetical protein
MTEFWDTDLQQTVRNTRKLVQRQTRARDVGDWLQDYSDIGPPSSNQGAANVPFQRWFHFKEAFSPKFVADVLGSLPYRVERCLDPFGGSGTTGLTCRMLGINSTTVEVNPFLADLIRAKLTSLSPANFCAKYERILSTLVVRKADEALVAGMPATLREPGIGGKFVFSADVYSTTRAILRRAQYLDSDHARLLRVLLGSVLVENSNVTINGKGRRYRKSARKIRRSGSDLIHSLDEAVDTAAADLTKFSGMPRGRHLVIHGDSRTALKRVKYADVAIFSPPYPNSFDYTDVYNLELWMLGYLRASAHNTTLRRKTFRSHVQIKWTSAAPIAVSKQLTSVVRALERKRGELWNRNIPEMVQYYFDDLSVIFRHLSRILSKGHHAVVAIGDSQYAGVHIDVAGILTECVAALGFRLSQQGEIRSMRNSSQHGGSFDLSEHCLVFERV